MLSGFNTNIRHRGVLFHVQSEDSGRQYPHIITHLYHGGTILASEKSSYADHLEDPDLPRIVRQCMESQHKAVLKRLRASQFDELIVQRLGASIFAEASDTRAETKPADDALSLPTPCHQASVPDPVPEPEPQAGEAGEGRAFGQGIVSEKPLDEVILSYLVESARRRKQRRS